MTGNNPKLDLVNVDVHTKFSPILSIRSQDIERKRNSDINQGPSIKGHNSVKILRKMTGNNPKLDLVNVDVHTKFGQILSSHSQDSGWKQKCRKDGRTEGRNNRITELRKDRVNPV